MLKGKLCVTIMLMLAVSSYGYVDLGGMGETYPIVEKNLYNEINARAAKIDMQAIVDEYFEASFAKATTGSLELPVATTDREQKITPQHTLMHELFVFDKGGNKQVIYPAGFTYNPLDYMQIGEQYVVINATRDAEVRWLQAWLKDSEVTGRGRVMVIITQGALFPFMERLDLQAYLLTEEVRAAIHVTATPSVVTQVKNQLVVREYLLKGDE